MLKSCKYTNQQRILVFNKGKKDATPVSHAMASRSTAVLLLNLFTIPKHELFPIKRQAMCPDYKFLDW